MKNTVVVRPHGDVAAIRHAGAHQHDAHAKHEEAEARAHAASRLARHVDAVGDLGLVVFLGDAVVLLHPPGVAAGHGRQARVIVLGHRAGQGPLERARVPRVRAAGALLAAAGVDHVQEDTGTRRCPRMKAPIVADEVAQVPAHVRVVGEACGAACRSGRGSASGRTSTLKPTKIIPERQLAPELRSPSGRTSAGTSSGCRRSSAKSDPPMQHVVEVGDDEVAAVLLQRRRAPPRA